MTKMKFTVTGEPLLEMLSNYIEGSLEIKSDNPDNTVYFHNGDKLTVNVETGMAEYEPLVPGDFSHSKVTMRVHQWLMKGLLKAVEDDATGV